MRCRSNTEADKDGIATKLLQVDVVARGGKSCAPAVLTIAMPAMIYFHRPAEHGGMKSDQVSG
jgi:hypothetical protein